MLNKKNALSLLAVSCLALGGLTYGGDALGQIARPTKKVQATFSALKRTVPYARIVSPTSQPTKAGFTMDMNKTVNLVARVTKPKGYKQNLQYRWEISDSPAFTQAIMVGSKTSASFVPGRYFRSNQHIKIYVRFIAHAGPHSTTDTLTLQYDEKVN